MDNAPPATEPITHTRVLKVAIPIMLANVTVPILGAVDTGVVGQIPAAEPIAAVGVGAIIISAFYWIFGFLRMGTVGLTAQAAGEGNRAEVTALLTRALLIGFAGGVAILVLLTPLLGLAFAVSPTEPEVETLARDYMNIRIWSAPAAIAMYGISGWLIAQERTRAVLVMQLWMNGVNIVLDLLFVLEFGWGVQGVAIATFIAEWSGLALGLWLCRDAFGDAAWRAWGRVFDRVKLKRLAIVNTDILIRSLLLEAIFLSFLFVYSAGFGTTRLAANQVTLQFLHIIAYALDGFAFAAEALVGQAVGARAVRQLRRAALLTSGWGLACNGVFTLAFAIAGPAIIDLMAKDPGVREAAREVLPWVVAAPVVGLASWMLDGIFIGATRTSDMRNMMAVSAAVYFAAVYVLVPPLGIHGLWLALMISLVTRGVTLGLRYPALERDVAAGRPDGAIGST